MEMHCSDADLSCAKQENLNSVAILVMCKLSKSQVSYNVDWFTSKNTKS